ncbi:hypothetical protein L195_g022496, partial [Trifolium pratense]
VAAVWRKIAELSEALPQRNSIFAAANRAVESHRRAPYMAAPGEGKENLKRKERRKT